MTFQLVFMDTPKGGWVGIVRSFADPIIATHTTAPHASAEEACEAALGWMLDKIRERVRTALLMNPDTVVI